MRVKILGDILKFLIRSEDKIFSEIGKCHGLFHVGDHVKPNPSDKIRARLMISEYVTGRAVSLVSLLFGRDTVHLF